MKFDFDHSGEQLKMLIGFIANGVKDVCESKGSTPQPIIDAQKAIEEYCTDIPEDICKHALSAIDWVYSTYHETSVIMDMDDTIKN